MGTQRRGGAEQSLRTDEVTAILRAAAEGQPDAFERLLPLVYDELQAMARSHRRQWRDIRAPGTLSLVHEAYLKLVDQTSVQWETRAQFFYLASRAMRCILIDNARTATRQKRGGRDPHVPVSDDLLVSETRGDELLALDDALTRLAGANASLARIVECRFFGGLTIEETAKALQLSPATVKRGWATARGWLYRALEDAPEPPNAS